MNGTSASWLRFVATLGLSGALAAGIWIPEVFTSPTRVALTILLLLGVYFYWLKHIAERHLKYMFIVPSVVVMLSVTFIPMLYLAYISFHRVTMLNFRGEWPFVALLNFTRLLFDDPLFIETLVRSMQLLVFALALQFVIGLMLALMCNRDFRGKPLIGTILLLPIMTNTIVVGLLWKYMLDYQTGLINLLLGFVGIEPQPWLTNQGLPGIKDLPLIGPWLVQHFNAHYAFFAIIWTNTWQWTPFVFLVLMAGLSSLPQEPFEAAKVDGASPWQTFIYVTLPMLKPVIGVILLIRAVDLMKSFGLIWALFGNAPFTRIMNIHIHTLGLGQQNYSMGAALSIIVGIISVFIYVLFRKVFLSDRVVE